MRSERIRMPEFTADRSVYDGEASYRSGLGRSQGTALVIPQKEGNPIHCLLCPWNALSCVACALHL